MSQYFDTQISVSPAQFYFILKYSQIKFKAFTQGGKKMLPYLTTHST